MPKVPHGEFTQKAPYLLDGVVLVDPLTGQPYKAGVTIQQVDGGFDPTGLATDAKQDETIAAISDLADAVVGESAVTIIDDELPPIQGQATANKQDQIIASLQSLGNQLGLPLTVSLNNGSLAVTISEVPLAPGASTSAKQDAALTLLSAIRDIFQTGTLAVAGEVSLSGADIGALKTVTLDNPSIEITSSSALAVTLPGVSTAEKQDTILSRLQTLIDNSLAPRPITDNGGSVTVDGNVGISGPVASTQSGPWTVSAAQSGAWSATTLDATGNGLTSATAAPTSGDRGIVVRNIPSGTQAVSGTVSATQSGTWNVTNTAANAGTLTTTPTAISVGTTSVQLAASVTGRKSVIVHNMGGTTLFLSFAATAVATVATFQVPSNNWIVIDRETWTGVITGIRASGSAAADAIVTVTS